MKNILIIILAAVTAFSSCRKDDPSVFMKSADERLNEALTNYQTQLAGAQYGWKGFIYPKGGGTYSFYFKFNNSNRVQMLSSFDSVSAVTLKESSYRLKALQQPSLLFDTYSYLHVLSDPTPSVNGGPVGTGLQSDFEFYFDSSVTDTIKLIGRFNGSKATLIRASQTEATAFNTGQLANGLLLNKILTYYKRLKIGATSLDFYFDQNSRSIKFTDNTGNLLDSAKISNYYLTLGGITLNKPIAVGNLIISSINNLTYVPANQTINCTVNNLPATVTEALIPLKVDVGAPFRWWKSAAVSDNYYYSIYGFHVNGVDDAYGITNLTSGTFPYYFLIYYPNYAPATKNDLFAPVFLNVAANSLSIEYGTAPRTPTFTLDGRAVFTSVGDYGPYPSTGPAGASRAQLYNLGGYYFIQTSEGTYDMVSGENGKAWISWIRSQ